MLQTLKSALCAFDNKRYILDDGIYTLAYGHKDIPNRVEINKIDDPAREKVITELEARRVGLLWKRSKGIATRLGYDPGHRVEETDEEALEAGKRMGVGIQNLLAQVRDLPDRYIPQGRKPHKRIKPPKQGANSSAPLKRVRLLSDSEHEVISKDVSSITGYAAEECAVNGATPTVLSTPRNAETSSSKRSSSSIKHRHVGSRGRVSNPFIISEAEESGDEDTDSKASSRSKCHSSSDSDSESDSESDDCFIVDNNCFD